jgi:transcriptional regulator with XRE-family HTH domain
LRRLQGLTQQELAEAAGVSLGTVNRLERGVREPRPGTMRRIAAVLGVKIADVDEFVGDVPDVRKDRSARGGQDGGGMAGGERRDASHAGAEGARTGGQPEG